MIILFVCTDNIGRSLVAELLLKDYLTKHNIDDIEVLSAGTNADSDISNFEMSHFRILQDRGIDPFAHQRTRLNEDLVSKSDFIITMDTTHKQWIEDQFGAQSFLFNEICNGEKTSVTVASIGMNKMVDYIDSAIPNLIDFLQQTNKLPAKNKV